jgi:spore photoproduct lyase
LKESGNTLIEGTFSHIYVEKDIFRHPETQKILKKFRKSTVIPISGYKEVFSRARQDICFQKRSRKLILARKKTDFLYRGSSLCPDFGHKNFFYSTMIMNCLYDCDYCYLQGMFGTANIVIFVNVGDFLKDVKKNTRKEKMYLCISQDTDLLLFEKIIPLCSVWIEFARNNKNLALEIRTKSASYKTISHIKPAENVILSWTLLPDEIIGKYERNTPDLSQRLESINKALKHGWKVRLCFDPLIYMEDFENVYGRFVDVISRKISLPEIQDAYFDVFRMNEAYFRRIKKNSEDMDIFYMEYENENGIVSYKKELAEKMKKYFYSSLLEVIPDNKIFRADAI